MKLKVLVTGATGFVGSHITRMLVHEKKYAVFITCQQTSNFSRISDIIADIDKRIVNIADKNAIYSLMDDVKPDIILHLANLGVYGGKEGAAEEAVKVNLLGTMNVIEACRNIPYRCFINTGSSAEYGPKTKAMREDDYCEPQGVYAISKLAATQFALLEAKRFKKPIVTLRLFSPFGPSDDKNRLISYLIAQATLSNTINLHNPKGVRDYVYIDDVVSAYKETIQHINHVKGNIINIGSGKQTTVKEVVKIIMQATDSKSRISYQVGENSRVYESVVWKASTRKAISLLNWKPKNTLKGGIFKTVAWYKKTHQSYV